MSDIEKFDRFDSLGFVEKWAFLEEAHALSSAERGIHRVQCFVSLGIVGFGVGFWSFWFALKLVVVGGVLGRAVALR